MRRRRLQNSQSINGVFDGLFGDVFEPGEGKSNFIVETKLSSSTELFILAAGIGLILLSKAERKKGKIVFF